MNGNLARAKYDFESISFLSNDYVDLGPPISSNQKHTMPAVKSNQAAIAAG